jgi:hypothetical protein
MKAKKLNSIPEGYFEELPKGTQELVKALLLEVFHDATNLDLYPYDDDAIEFLECHSRDGFIPHSFNKGGLEIKGFTDLMGIFGSGQFPSHEGARKEIERQIEYSINLVSESVFERNQEVLESRGITQKQTTYGHIQDLIDAQKKQLTLDGKPQRDGDLDNILEDIQETETEILGGSESSIMYTMRFMYHGKDNGTHSASISAAVNTEGPYHRSHISWAPNVFCEGAKEVEITWRTQKELRQKLKKALEQVSKKVF